MRPLRFVPLAGALAASLALAQAPELTVQTPFAVGGAVTYTIRGEPGAAYALLLSQTPAREAVSDHDVRFLAEAATTVATGGRLDERGEAVARVTLSGEPGALWYAQARVDGEAAARRYTNSVAARVVADEPSGPRESVRVVVTPDGTKAYAAHEIDGSVSVVDLVAGVKVNELPISAPAISIPYIAADLAIDPEGRHLFVVSTAADRMAVVDIATDSVVAQVVVPRGTRRVGFDFNRPFPRIYATNEVANAVLVFEERTPGAFTRRPNIPLQGDDPTTLLVLPDGRLVVGNRATHDLEFVDPFAPPGSTTLARTPIQGLPHDIAFAAGQILVPTFVPVPGAEGANRVLRVDPATFQVTGFMFEDIGTDYVDIAATDELVAIVAASTGTLLFGDPATGAVIDNVELAPGPTATPQQAAFAFSGGQPSKVYAIDYFRETLRPVVVAGGPPFTRENEIPLAWSGAPRRPLSGDLSMAEDGDWFVRSVNLFGGDAFHPNRVTCYSCHVDGASDNIKRGSVAPPIWGIGQTGPWGQTGGSPNLRNMIAGAMQRHNHTGNPVFPGGEDFVLEFFNTLKPPVSIYRTTAGALTPPAQQGKAIFESIGCTTCHQAPLFIPRPPNPRTIPNGIGTGLVPANVPSLRGVWALAPYLANASAPTLRDVLTGNPNDRHGQLTAGLTPTQIDQLVAYLQSL